MEIVINQLNDDIDNLLIKRNNIDSEIVNLLLAPSSCHQRSVNATLFWLESL